MKTIKKIISIAVVLLMSACNKDDGPSTPTPDPQSENHAPDTFDLLNPKMDEDGASRIPSFSWEQATDPDGDAVVYDVYLDTNENPSTLIAENLSSITFTLQEELNLKTEYYWKVVAKDGKAKTTTSTIGSFVTEFPIVFLKKFNSGLEGPGTLSFDYNQGILTNMEYTFGNRWQLNYDEASGKLSRTGRELSGELVAYIYEYTSFGKQKSIKLARSGKKESWDLDYDGKERLASVVYEIEEIGGEGSKVSVTLIYADENSSKPAEMTFVTTYPDSPETIEIKIGLEWDGENIISAVVEGTEKGEIFSITAKYTYDKDINPYFILTKNKFGFDTFFSHTIKTAMESIDFGPFYWQSKNNILKKELTQTSVKGGLFTTTDTYEYTYSEDYYPLTSTVVHRGGMPAEETRELSWSY